MYLHPSVTRLSSRHSRHQQAQVQVRRQDHLASEENLQGDALAVIIAGSLDTFCPHDGVRKSDCGLTVFAGVEFFKLCFPNKAPKKDILQTAASHFSNAHALPDSFRRRGQGSSGEHRNQQEQTPLLPWAALPWRQRNTYSHL